nr:protein NUCLEAR FUSION DEFECTIVE 6, chloroplastic/mitochondrial-like [Ipomoea batatas]GMD56201.1 protein NUCLEAR FUSION DEFECTIVE 6, chloroplastic/mitochondrial-like [Ipomoea batatas]
MGRCRLPVELGCVESLMPLHSRIASSLLRSKLSSEVGNWGFLSEALKIIFPSRVIRTGVDNKATSKTYGIGTLKADNKALAISKVKRKWELRRAERSEAAIRELSAESRSEANAIDDRRRKEKDGNGIRIGDRIERHDILGQPRNDSS